MNMTLYYIALFAHLIFLVIGFGSVIVIDTFGLLWLRKKVTIEFVQQVANTTQKLIWLGWGGLVASGAVLLWYQGTVGPRTILKLFFVAMLGVNGIFLHYIKKNFGKNSQVDMRNITLASTISQIGWWGAIIIGFLNSNVW